MTQVNNQWPEIFSVSISYFDPNYTDDANPNGQRNHDHFHYKPFESLAEAESFAKDKGLKSILAKRKEKNITSEISDIKINVVSKGRHRWWLEWFCHATYQKFDTPEAAERDFYKFCFEENNFDRYESYSDKEQREKFIWCPMGAGDIGRWRVCDCVHCKEQGITRIIH